MSLPPSQVRHRLIDLLSGPHVKLSGDGATLAFEGAWWYRGEYTLLPCEQGTQVTYHVYNVATRARWLVPLVNRLYIGFAAATRKGFTETLRSLTR
ncbi:hypothetical protein [Actinomadura rupiterrae]|uniref:hypothetical protein n=1 Tax=Actinomadura rupiterrae TaxID=559627 RepID=UPI0020A4A0B0|nr:hypothetical protein [Actinomadura rupiterrae]MCP2335195.1 hypothetical protein [Actinomadura rupiterrae]